MEGVELPVGWRLATLGELADVRGGYAFPHKYQGSTSGKYAFYKVSDMNLPGNETTMHLSNNWVGDDVISILRAKPFPRNTIVFPKVGAAVYTNKKRILSTDALIDNNVMGVSVCALDSCLPEFLLYWFEHTDLTTFSNPGPLPSITAHAVRDAVIPLPPLPEQRAMARALRAVQEAKATRQREVALERERKAALMEYLFTYGAGSTRAGTRKTKFGLVPKRWQETVLDKCAYVQTGVTKGRNLNGSDTVSLPYLRVANVQDGHLDLSEIKEIRIRVSEVERYRLQPGDVVLTEGGDFDKLGRGFVWEGQIPNCVHQNHIFAVRVNREMLRPEFLAYLVQSSYGKNYFLSVAHKTTNLASINSTKLKAFPMLVPSLEEQQAIVTIMQSCDAKIATLDREIALLDELFRAMLEELMTGRLSALPLVERVPV